MQSNCPLIIDCGDAASISGVRVFIVSLLILFFVQRSPSASIKILVSLWKKTHPDRLMNVSQHVAIGKDFSFRRIC